MTKLYLGYHVDADYSPDKVTSETDTVQVAKVALVETAVATLEADGAAPTQAHVTALRTQWNALKTAMTATGTKDVMLAVDLSKFDALTKKKDQIVLITESIERVLEDSRNFGLPG